MFINLAIVDLLLDGVIRHQPINMRGFNLSITVDPTHGLGVVTGVPRGVQHHHPIGPHQIDAQRPRSSRYQEEWDVRGRVKRVDEILTIHRGSGTVQSEVGPTFDPRRAPRGVTRGPGYGALLQEVFQEVQSD